MVMSDIFCQRFVSRLLCVLVMLWLSLVSISCTDSSTVDIYKLYSKGKSAYKKEKWSLCVKHIGTTVSLYNRYKQTLLQCVVKCKKDHAHSYTNVQGESESVIDYILKANPISERDCVRSCQESSKGQMLDNLKSNFPKDFERMKPYFYLQHCLNKVGQVSNAVSAAYTFLVRNPGNDDVLSMLAVYRYQHYNPDHMILDLEERPYVKHRKDGENAYRHGKWSEAVKHFESAVKEYYQEDELCRAQCDVGYRSTSSGLTQIIVAAVTAILQCQRRCSDTLSHLYGQTYPNYLSDHYLYLLAAHVKAKEYVQALEAVTTYLTFRPDDQQVTQYRNDHLKEFQNSDSEPTLGRDAALYMKTRKHITDLLDELVGSDHHKTKYYSRDEDVETEEYSEEIRSSQPGPSSVDDVDSLLSLEDMRLLNTTEILNNLYTALRADVSLTGEALKHDKRVVMDNVFTNEVCDDIMRVSQNGIKNAGYHDIYPTAVRPNFAKELYTGFDIMDGWELVLAKQLKERDVDLMTRLAEKTRLLVGSWFNETRPIYHDYTQFTCRKALDGKQTNRTSEDLSHPVHGDSCDFRPDQKICATDTAAYPWRTYSAVLYFNDNFEGGKFFFANPDQTEQVSIVPKCGRMVAFPSDHLHGVKAVTKGKRCAATIWFTATATRRQPRPTWSGIVK